MAITVQDISNTDLLQELYSCFNIGDVHPAKKERTYFVKKVKTDFSHEESLDRDTIEELTALRQHKTTTLQPTSNQVFVASAKYSK